MKTWVLLLVAAVVVTTQLVCTFWLIWADREVTCNLKELKFAYLYQAYGQPMPGKLTLKGHCLH